MQMSYEAFPWSALEAGSNSNSYNKYFRRRRRGDKFHHHATLVSMAAFAFLLFSSPFLPLSSKSLILQLFEIAEGGVNGNER